MAISNGSYGIIKKNSLTKIKTRNNKEINKLKGKIK